MNPAGCIEGESTVSFRNENEMRYLKSVTRIKKSNIDYRLHITKLVIERRR